MELELTGNIAITMPDYCCILITFLHVMLLFNLFGIERMIVRMRTAHVYMHTSLFINCYK